MDSRKRDKDNDDTGGESSIDECLSFESSHSSFRVGETTSKVFPLLSEHPLAKSHGT